MRFSSLMVMVMVVGVVISWGTAPTACAQFELENIQLLANVPLIEMGGTLATRGNDIWGWTDSTTGREYAIVGRTDGTSFVDVTEPTTPVYLGNLPSHTSSSTWRDMKVYRDHAYVVSDNNGPHGLQIFDLTTLRAVTTPQTFAATAHFSAGGQFRSAHNIAINETTGFAYVVGSNLAAGGLYMLDLANPRAPVVAGQFSSDGYTHDVQVVNYEGPDGDFVGREIAFSSNVNTLTIVDVTSKSQPSMVSRTPYPGAQYAHQGWLSDDHRYFFMNDELDTKWTHFWDVSDLSQPDYLGFYPRETNSVDHNLYVRGNYLYASNYTSGLRVFDISDVSSGTMTPVAFLDTYPTNNNGTYNGSWSNYPFFDSGTIIINDMTFGLFVARLDIAQPDLNRDGQLDCVDLDLLTSVIALGRYEPYYDLVADGRMNIADRDAWLMVAGSVNLGPESHYLPGDANLDGIVDGQDFLAWNRNKFTQNSSWCSGDFTGDGIVDGADFLVWNAHKFQTSSTLQAVCEPTCSGAMMACLISIVASALRRRYSIG